MSSNPGIRKLPASAIAVAYLAAMAAHADETAPGSTTWADTGMPAAQAVSAPPSVNGLQSFFDEWAAWVADAKATQPSWAGPIATGTALLTQRVRFQVELQHRGDGIDITSLNSKGVSVIIGDTQEILISLPRYDITTHSPPHQTYTGFGDWPIFLFKQRLFSRPSDRGNYVVSAWMRITLPTGVAKLSSNATTLTPTMGFGKGWGAFDIQSDFGVSIHTSGRLIQSAFRGKTGDQMFGNLAFQYQLLDLFWPEVEVNWTNYLSGSRAGLNRVFITPGLTVARIPLGSRFKLTLAVGYQSAVAPQYRAKPLTPNYNHAWLLSTSLGF